MRLKFYCMLSLASLIVFSSALRPQDLQKPAAEFTSSDLPIVIINTNGQEIIDEPKITADMGIIDNGSARNNVTDSFNGYNGKIGIELRGQTSQGFPKKPYAVELRDTLGADLEASLLGMPKNEDWILYATYNDKTFMRDILIYKLARQLGWYASRTRYCELVLNGEYMGVYVLMEKIKRGKNRVNIAKMDTTCIAGDELTGGYIIKADKKDDDEDCWYSKYPGNGYNREFIYEYPKTEDITPEQKEYIKNYFDTFEDVLAGPNFADTANGYSKYIDVNSFIDYMLLTEFCKNVDGFRISTYMYKQRDSQGGKLFMGPLWDYNNAFGNCDYAMGPYSTGWQLDFDPPNPPDGDKREIIFWFKRLLEDKAFADKLNARWFQLRGTALKYENITAVMDSLALVVDEAKERNFERWPILDEIVWPNPYIWYTYAGEVAYLKTWIEDRLGWMDENMFGETIAVAEEPNAPMPKAYALMQNYPNPFNPSTVIKYQLKDAAKVTLKVYDMLGKEAAVLVDDTQEAGYHSARFEGANLAAGVYFYSLKAGSYTATKKMILLK